MTSVFYKRSLRAVMKVPNDVRSKPSNNINCKIFKTTGWRAMVAVFATCFFFVVVVFFFFLFVFLFFFLLPVYVVLSDSIC